MSNNPFMTQSPKRPTVRKSVERIERLSKPKVKLNTDEDTIGPADYSPSEVFLSTKVRSPSVLIGRSERFLRSKIREMRKSVQRLADVQETGLYNISEIVSPPKYSFKRTGHDLKLVNNPQFPGVGKYSPTLVHANSSFSFRKAKKNFNWKKGIG